MYITCATACESAVMGFLWLAGATAADIYRTGNAVAGQQLAPGARAVSTFIYCLRSLGCYCDVNGDRSSAIAKTSLVSPLHTGRVPSGTVCLPGSYDILSRRTYSCGCPCWSDVSVVSSGLISRRFTASPVFFGSRAVCVLTAPVSLTPDT